MASVAILILNYNGEAHLKRFLPSVIANSSGHDIIIGDNGSTDNSLNLLKESFPEVEIIELGLNHGYAKGYNLLIKEIAHDYIVLLNSDVEVTPNWTAGLISELESDEKVAAVQPKILSVSEKDKFEYAGAAGGYIDRYGYPFCRGRVFNSIENDNGQYNDKKAIFWASGACFMVKRDAFTKLNGFDGDFFAHMEEIDLCWRLQSAGYKIMYTSESSVYHLGGGTLSYSSPQKTYLNFRNGWVMLLKNLPQSHRSKTLAIRWLLDVISVFYYLLQLQFANAFAVIRAHLFIIKQNRKISNKALETKRLRNSSLFVEQMPFSLVKRHYLNNKHSYSDLVPD